MTEYCPSCWKRVEAGSSQCPSCGEDLAEADERSFEERLLGALDHPLREHRMIAIQILGELGSESALERFQQRIDANPDLYEMREILQALSKIGGPRCRSAIEAVMRGGGLAGSFAREALSTCAREPGRRIRGRDRFLARLEEKVRAGGTVLLLGPLGIGKTTLLAELARRAGARGVPWGLAPRTGGLRDVTAALASAYPEAGHGALTQRQLRSRLRLAVEERAGILLLDHFRTAGTALRGFLRSLRGTGLGIVLAVDVQHRRERDALRALGLTHLELTVPPLGGRAAEVLLGDLLARRTLPHALDSRDRRRLLQFCRGNPGRLAALSELLPEERYWREGRVRTQLLGMTAAYRVLGRRSGRVPGS